MPTLQEVIWEHAAAYRKQFWRTMPRWHRAALERLGNCRTGEAGRLYHACSCCGAWQMTPASCGHRACAQCGRHKAQQWQEKQQAKLLPVPYVMITFTVPSQLRSLFRENQKIGYHLLMQESAGTLQEIASDPKHLGGQIGATGVLHTWKRDLGYHPHVHYLLPSGAYTPQGWISPRKSDYFLPSAVLAVRMRNRFRNRLKAEHPSLWQKVPAKTWKPAWNVNIQYVGEGEKAFIYLARYIQSTAIRNSRLIKNTETHVRYKWTDRKSGQERKETVSGSEFLRRFCQHILPTGVVRVRHMGFLSAAAKKTFEAVKTALGVKEKSPPAATEGTPETPTTCQQAPTTEQASKGKPVCRKCQREMAFLEFRSVKQAGHPRKLDGRLQQSATPKPTAPIENASALPGEAVGQEIRPRSPPMK